ncbi:hypothetical protein H5410_006740 [Solanum commersonii]|uniref:KIB1-4 beta-propeller domain-containing protein n=1 Tax=Solanum commersonii TaxID=4109 RepID=A0A9J6ABD6_SOLCO|nr:hypothetical protein H5410_006740 [Solanum commersonii]
MAAAAAGNWAYLPEDIIDLIAKRVKGIEDFVAFCTVCTSWRTCAPKTSDDDDYREFYSLSKEKVSHLFYLPILPSPQIIYSPLAFWRPGDLNWTYVDINQQKAVCSLIFYKGRFYFSTFGGEIWAFEVSGPSIDVRAIKLVTIENRKFQWNYLVELIGSLLIIFLFKENGIIKFEVFEINLNKNELTGVKCNHIYFTNDSEESFPCNEGGGRGGGGRYMGAYNLNDGKIEAFYLGESLSPICPLTWVIPSY